MNIKRLFLRLLELVKQGSPMNDIAQLCATILDQEEALEEQSKLLKKDNSALKKQAKQAQTALRKAKREITALQKELAFEIADSQEELEHEVSALYVGQAIDKARIQEHHVKVVAKLQKEVDRWKNRMMQVMPYVPPDKIIRWGLDALLALDPGSLRPPRKRPARDNSPRD